VINLLKQASIESNKLWKSVGKPRNGPIFANRQSCRLKYRKCLRDNKKSETEYYTNDLHEALLQKIIPLFGHVGVQSLSPLILAFKLTAVLILVLSLIDFLCIFLEHIHVMMSSKLNGCRMSLSCSVTIIAACQPLMLRGLIRNLLVT